MKAIAKKKIGIGILGGTGYGAGELLRVLCSHPSAEVCSVVSSSQVGVQVSAAHPHLLGCYNLQFESELNLEKFKNYEHGVIVSALPHNASATTIARLADEIEKRNLKLVDLSGDFRLKNREQREKFYPESIAPDNLRSQFVYGQTETNRARISRARFVANPGCLSSTCILAAVPIVKKLEIEGAIVFDVKTGTSGAGKALKENLHHPSRFANFNAYRVLKHQHEPEILQGLGDEGSKYETFLVSHLLPISRGVFATLYCTVKNNIALQDVKDIFAKFYSESPFIRFREDSPEISAIVGTNFCDISIAVRGRQLVVMAALDNLLKGMVGTALQNINLMCGIDETAGLLTPALGPC